MPNQMSKTKRRISLTAETEIKTALVDIAESTGSSVSDVIKLCINNYLALDGEYDPERLVDIVGVQFDRGEVLARDYFQMETEIWVRQVTALANRLAEITDREPGMDTISRAKSLQIVSLILLLMPDFLPKA